MLSSVLRSDRAADVNVLIMRVFVQIRKVMTGNEDLARRVAQIDRRVTRMQHEFDLFINPPAPRKKPPIGFQHPSSEDD